MLIDHYALSTIGARTIILTTKEEVHKVTTAVKITRTLVSKGKFHYIIEIQNRCEVPGSMTFIVVTTNDFKVYTDKNSETSETEDDYHIVAEFIQVGIAHARVFVRNKMRRLHANKTVIPFQSQLQLFELVNGKDLSEFNFDL